MSLKFDQIGDELRWELRGFSFLRKKIPRQIYEIKIKILILIFVEKSMSEIEEKISFVKREKIEIYLHFD